MYGIKMRSVIVLLRVNVVGIAKKGELLRCSKVESSVNNMELNLILNPVSGTCNRSRTGSCNTASSPIKYGNNRRGLGFYLLILIT